MGLFSTSVSGLRAQEESIQVTSNNLANANTAGFKRSRAVFADLVAGQGVGRAKAGSGVRVADLQQNFGQGPITRTDLPSDLAIDGDGFFKMRDPNGDVTYTRAGQFEVDKEGYFVNSVGERLQAYAYDIENQRVTADEVDLQLDYGLFPPKQTNDIDLQLNLDSRSLAIPDDIPFDPTNLDSFHDSTTFTIYDRTGQPRDLQIYFRRNEGQAGDPTSSWSSFAFIDGDEVAFGTGNSAQINFLANGTLDPNSQLVELDLANVLDQDGNPAFDETTPVTINLERTTAFGSRFSVIDAQQNGYQSGEFLEYVVDATGKVNGVYSNGETRILAQISSWRFQDNSGLIPNGDNGWIAGPDSGVPIPNILNDDDTSKSEIISGAFEDSNVSVTNELVDLITSQRIYQANSTSFQTQDDVLQTAVNLRN